MRQRSGIKYPNISLTHLDNLWFQVTGTLCNLRCSHCFNNSGPNVKTFGLLTHERVKQDLEAAVRMGVKEVFFTGGEPFLHSSIAELLSESLRCAPTTVLTNGTPINDRMADRLAEIEIRARYSLEIRVSLDSFDERSNDSIRGRGVFGQVMDAVRRLTQRGLFPLIAVVRTWSDEEEPEILSGFARVLRAAGCERPRLKILPALPLGRALQRDGHAHQESYATDSYVTEEMMLGFDRDLLMCSNSRIVTDRGVWVCPLLVEMPDARLGDRLESSGGEYSLSHRACISCYRYGTICGNVDSRIEGVGLDAGPRLERKP